MLKPFATALATAALTTSALAASALAASPFANGSFERPALSPWKATKGKVNVTARWPAADGRKSIALNNCEGTTLTQTFKISPGEYVLHFKLAASPKGDYGVKHLAAAADGDSDSFTFDSTVYRGRKVETARDMSWQHHKMDFSTEATSTTVEFTTGSSSPGCRGPLLDDVRVVARPTT